MRVAADVISAAVVLTLMVVLATPAAAHDWYSDLISERGVSCCHDEDCRPVPSEYRGGQLYGYIEELDSWLPVPAQSTAFRLHEPYDYDGPKSPVYSTDGQTHACITGLSNRPRVRCWIPPGSGS